MEKDVMSVGRAIAGLMLGSTLVSSALADDGARTPDLAGPWGRNAFSFEPLPEGPQPLVNLKRGANGGSDLGQLVGDYRNPILKPEIAEIVKKKGEISISGHAYPDPSNQCRPYAPPFTLAMQLGLEMLQKKDGVTIIYNQDDQVRHVRLNASHPAKVIPSAMGDSVGHYEGDTLVVDTVGIATGPYTMVDRFGTPHSEALHVIDRNEKVDGRLGGVPGVMNLDPDTTLKGLQVHVTVEDPRMFTTPWSADVTYRRMSSSVRWQEQVCAENPNEYYAGRWVGLPKADRPDF
jgi:hypothetical protein